MRILVATAAAAFIALGASGAAAQEPSAAILQATALPHALLAVQAPHAQQAPQASQAPPAVHVPLSAQPPAASFDALASRIKAGDTVVVETAAGRTARARLVSLSPASLDIQLDGAPRTIQAGDIVSISRRGHRPIGKGAIWGLAVGGGLGVAVMLTPNDGCTYRAMNGSCADVDLRSATAVFVTVLGAGIGTVVGALIPPRMKEVYRAPGAPRVSLAPIVSRSRQGVAVRLTF
jgi:hypothetical protein